MILNRAKDYYENDKERLKRQARDKYRNLSEEEKNKRSEYGKNRYHNMLEEKKQRLKEYKKNSVCYLFRCTLLNPYIYAILNKLMEMKA